MPGVADILSLGVAPDRAQALCVFVHGRGQTPEDMEAAVLRRLSAPGVAFALPRARGKSWYQARAVDPRTDEARSELAESLAGLAGVVRGLRASAPGRPLLLAGFSQGACLSLEHGFTGLDEPDAIAALTGCRVGVPGDERPARLPEGLPVYLTGGSADPWIPPSAFAQAAAEIAVARGALRADVFPDRPHEVSGAEIAMLDAILSDMAAGRSPRMEAPR